MIITTFISGKAHGYRFMFILFSVAVVGSAFIFCTLAILNRHAKNIDRLEDAQREAYEARDRFLAARDTLTKTILNNHNKI